jgi:DNA invertase Pin-like site-specific DNA recombinase
MTVYGYVRTARPDDDRSLEEQRESITRACDEQGYEVKRILEERCSGTTPFIDRPVWAGLSVRLEHGDVLVVADPTRLSRSMHDLGHVLMALRQTGVTVVLAGRHD